MKIGPNTVVSVTYDLHANNNDDPRHNFIETAGRDNPMEFIYGVGGMIPAFEDNLTGKTAGEKFEFSINAADAYGEFDEAAGLNRKKEFLRQIEFLCRECPDYFFFCQRSLILTVRLSPGICCSAKRKKRVKIVFLRDNCALN